MCMCGWVGVGAGVSVGEWVNERKFVGESLRVYACMPTKYLCAST